MKIDCSRQYHRGTIINNPYYLKQQLAEYMDNPCIEALPDIFDEGEVIEKISCYPDIEKCNKDIPASIRYHMIMRLKDFVQPIPIHLKIERKLSTMIRRGYLARNVASNEYLQRLGYLTELLDESDEMKKLKLNSHSSIIKTSAECFSIIGISGMGKTTAIENLLLMYPQIIVHSIYKGHNLTRTQITWLKIDCPYDGSLKTLCKIFFNAVDDVLGDTDYFKMFGKDRVSTATMMIHMGRLACMYSLGVLVIDEVQHLINPKNKSDEMLNFFVTLVNTVGVPTILIGTPKAQELLERDFRQARRAAGAGCVMWDRMKNDSEWRFFLETMWDFQWLKKKTELTDELTNVFYDKSQGITAVAVSLFIFTQERAIETYQEKITEKLIEKCAEEDLAFIQNMIRALRNNNYEEIRQYHDICINIEAIIRNKKYDRDTLENLIKQREECKQRVRDTEKNLRDEIIMDVTNMGILENIDSNRLFNLFDNFIRKNKGLEDKGTIKRSFLKMIIEKEDLCKRSSKQEVKKIINNKSSDIDLRDLFKMAVKEKKHVYELLKNANLIKHPDEFNRKRVNI